MSKICLLCGEEKKNNTGEYHTKCNKFVYKVNYYMEKYKWTYEQACDWTLRLSSFRNIKIAKR